MRCIRRTLLGDIPLSFPSGQCRPLASFGRDHGHEVPVAAYCAGTDTTATLSKWAGTTKLDLLANIATPLPFELESDADATTFLVNLASPSVATVTTGGEVTFVDPAARYVSRARSGSRPSPDMVRAARADHSI